MSRNEHLVILIDDDNISNMLTAETITGIYPIDKVLAFTDPAEGMQAVIHSLNNKKKIILFLDVNMPGLSGWDVVEALGVFSPTELLNLIRIYMLSSSVDMKDKIKAYSYQYVAGYFEKPLEERDFQDILFKRNYIP